MKSHLEAPRHLLAKMVLEQTRRATQNRRGEILRWPRMRRALQKIETRPLIGVLGAPVPETPQQSTSTARIATLVRDAVGRKSLGDFAARLIGKVIECGVAMDQQRTRRRSTGTRCRSRAHALRRV